MVEKIVCVSLLVAHRDLFVVVVVYPQTDVCCELESWMKVGDIIEVLLRITPTALCGADCVVDIGLMQLGDKASVACADLLSGNFLVRWDSMSLI